jgi:cyclic 2,3-diphosphoglycerate synthase
MTLSPVIALVDGEHHPAVVRDALVSLERERGVAGVVFCGGEEKVGAAVLADPEPHYGRPVEVGDPAEALRRLAAAGQAGAVFDIADEPIVPPPLKLRLASLALHLGLAYEAPGVSLTPPRFERVAFEGPKLAVIGTGKRTGKTAVAGHWAKLLHDRGARPVIVSMGRGGPPEPQLAPAGTSLDDLLAIAAEGRHAASDYLEDAALAGVAAVGCRRVGGGLAGEPYRSNVAEGAALAAAQSPGALVFEGSGSCLPPVEVDRTVCIVGDPRGALGELGPYRLMRADLALVMNGDDELAAQVARFVPGRVGRCTLRPEPVEPLPDGARVALFTTGATSAEGVEPAVASTNLARRSDLAADLERAAAAGCDVFLTEIKAAGIDTVAAFARDRGARVVFLRNRPVGLDIDLDSELIRLHDDAQLRNDA